MKDDLMLKKYKTENVYGTFNLLEENTFFGSKIMDIEDEIPIEKNSIKYYQVFDYTNNPILTKKNGYQFYNYNSYEEHLFVLNINNLKIENHTISKAQQSEIDEKLNTKWNLLIDQKSILREYLFARIKEARTFKAIYYNNLANKNINESIYDYIDLNLLDRYEFSHINFYVKYIDIRENLTNNNIILKQYDPTFDIDMNLDKYYVSNINIETENNVNILPKLKVKYNQTMPSTENKFNYYFNLYFRKI